MFREYDIRGRQEGIQLKSFKISICVKKITYESEYYCHLQKASERLILQQEEENEIRNVRNGGFLRSGEHPPSNAGVPLGSGKEKGLARCKVHCTSINSFYFF